MEVAVLVIEAEYSNTGSIHHMNTHTQNAHRYVEKQGKKERKENRKKIGKKEKSSL